MGVILYALISKSLPFSSQNRKELYNMIKEAQIYTIGPGWKTVSNDCLDLLKKLMKKEPKERMDEESALKHRFLRKINNQHI